ncbi:MAG TPA: hypothetical protein PK816_02945 [Candidatus Cloacimonadota bacterium]|jgi:tetratricopeptide (TPR) repeat protein|nr:hypothetical protein [Candidatus Cloacimonadota bacterium]
MLKKTKYILFSLIILSSACSQNKYESAKSMYETGNYPVAIEEFDKIISKSKNGYEITLSEENRSESYYQLGIKALERKNYNLAIRLFYLANSDKADEKIIECYTDLIQEFKEKDQKTRIIATYNYIISNLYQSPRVPEFIYQRISAVYEWYQNEKVVWDDYCFLYDRFPQSEYVSKSQVIIDQFIKKWIDELVNLKHQKDTDLSFVIDRLNAIKVYPSSYQNYISKEIALIYIQIAENNIVMKEYIQAEQYFRIALQYDETQDEYVRKRLNDVCDLFISHGNSLLDKRLIDEAIVYYNRSFQIIPEYPKAIQAIARAEKRRQDIARSLELKEEGLQLERKKKYPEALEYYKRAYSLDNTDELNKLIFEVTNIIQIEKDPRSFALKVLNEYRGGAIVSGVNSLRADLNRKWAKDLKDSGWKTIGAANRFKMELRYDLITPDENFFLSWQVNMKDRTLIPLNKLTEKLFGK